MQFTDPTGDATAIPDNPTAAPQTPWWQQPRPAGYPPDLPWPPPLPAGASYGDIPGQVNYAAGTTVADNPRPVSGGGTPAAPPLTDPPNIGPNPPPAGPPANVGGLIQPFGQTFTPPPFTAYPNAPTFTPPTMDQAANDEGYRFSLNQGKKNLESWLAAHGTFNDSSAAEALQQYGQGAAATQYNNVWGRQFAGYQASLGPWQTDVATIQHDNDSRWQDAFNTWLQNWNVFKDQRDSTFNHQFLTANA